MSSERKAGLRGGFQLKLTDTGLLGCNSNLTSKNSSVFFGAPAAPKKRSLQVDLESRYLTPSNGLSAGSDCIKDALKSEFKSTVGRDDIASSLDLISSDVQRILQESIDFVPAKNLANSLLLNVQKKCVDLSAVKLSVFASSNALPVRPPPPSKPAMGIEGAVPQNGAASRLPSVSQPSHSLANGGSPSKSGSDNDLPLPKTCFYDEGRIRLEWERGMRIGSGLLNVGNTCFLNATLQCLAYTPALYNYLSTDDHFKNCRTIGFCIVCGLRRTVLHMVQSPSAFRPNDIISNIKAFAKTLSIGRQEDAHEFLRLVVDAMRKPFLQGYNLKTLDMYSQETTIASRLFGGYYRSRVTCSSCGNPSSTYDPFMDIQLDVHKNISSLDEALRLYVKPEQLASPSAFYNCEQCKRKCSAIKQVTVHKPPNILTFHLKRFLHNNFSSFSKIDKLISYPEQLDFRPYMSRELPSENVQYRLYAVLVHLGSSCHSGHYYSYVRTTGPAWYKMDDCSVQMVTRQAALGQKAYLLFYSRMPSDVSSRSSSFYSSSQVTKHNIPQTVKSAASSTVKNIASALKPGTSVNVPVKPSVTGNGPAMPVSSLASKPLIGPVLVREPQKPKTVLMFQPRPMAVKKPVVTAPVINLNTGSLVPYASDDDEDSNPRDLAQVESNREIYPSLREPDLEVPPPVGVAKVIAIASARKSEPISNWTEVQSSDAMVLEPTSSSSPRTPVKARTPPSWSEVPDLEQPSSKRSRSSEFLVNSPVEEDKPTDIPLPEVRLDKVDILLVGNDPGVSDREDKKKLKKKHKKEKRDRERAASSVSSSAGAPRVEWVEKMVAQGDVATASPSVPSVSVVTTEPQLEPPPFSSQSQSPRKQRSAYGSEVVSWGGERSVVDREEDAAKREKQKRRFEESHYDQDLDCGRQKKVKSNDHGRFWYQSNRNGFQDYENRRSSCSGYRKAYHSGANSHRRC